MGTVSISGSLTGGPGSSGGFPASTFNTPISLATGSKLFQHATGVLTRIISSPAAFVALSAVGAANDVPKADTLYLRADADVDLRITQDDGAGGSTVLTLPVRGLFVMETPTNKMITLLEVQGSGKLEYFASGA